MTTKFLIFISFIVTVNSSLSCTEKVNRTLDVVWKVEGKNLFLEYTNQSNDTIYVADLSLSRNKGQILPNTPSGDVNINFYLTSSNGKREIDLKDGVKIFLGASAISPKEKHVLVYGLNGNTLNKLTVEYSIISPKLAPHSFKKLVIHWPFAGQKL